MITESKKCKMAFLMFSLVCFVAIGVCLICDLAINKRITWFGYVVSGVFFSWAILSPTLLAKSNKVLYSLISLTIVTIPFLYFLQYFTPVKGWFSTLGVPIAITGIGVVWITSGLIRFLRINKWYLSAIIVFLFGVVEATVVRYIVSGFVGKSFFSLDNVINFFACIVVAALLCMMGYNKNQSERVKPAANHENNYK